MAPRTRSSLLLLLAAAATAQEYDLVEVEHAYDDGNGGELNGYLIYQDIPGSPARPGLMVFPGPWGDGGGASERAVARSYAERGMAVFLPDYMTTRNSEDNAEQAGQAVGAYGAFLADTVTAQQIALLGLRQLTSLDITDADRVGAIGFCFGGAMVLNLARAGGKLTVAVSLHGEYPALGEVTGEYDVGYFVEMVGDSDPLIPAAARDSWMSELGGYTQGTAMDYDLQIWGNALHAFSIRYSDTIYAVMAGAFGGTVGENGVIGIVEYSEGRMLASFDRIDDLFEAHGLLAPPMTTCGALRDFYGANGCCGMPDKMVPMMGGGM